MILFKYIFKEILILTLVCTAIILSITWLIQSLREVQIVVENGASLIQFFYLSVLPLPLWILITLPFGLLIAVILLFSRLDNDNEITIFRFSGLSNSQIALPTILFLILSMTFLYITSFYLVPYSYKIYKSKQYELRNNISKVLLREDVFTDLQDGLTVLIKEKNHLLELKEIFIFDTRGENKVDFFSHSGKLLLTSEGPILQLFNGFRRTINSEEQEINKLYFENYSINLIRKKTNKSRWLENNEKSIPQLFNEGTPSSLAEAHFRLTIPILGFTIPFQALVILLCFSKRQQKQSLKITGIIIISITIEILLMISRNYVISNPNMWIFFYMISILPIFFMLLILIQKDINNKNLIFNNEHK